jgi:sensor domain CHASE-containing protein
LSNTLSLNKSSAEVIASSFSSKIENSLHHGLSATYPLAALIRTQQGRMDGFSQLATEMLPNYPGVNSLQLQPNGIVTEIVPLAGNEAALDHNLLADPKRDKEAFQAKETRQLTLAGPFNLMQGGVGAVARLPVYLDTETGSEFWGFTAALLLFPHILEPANLSALTKAGLAYQLVKKTP